MKIFAILGSPNKKGSTAHLLENYLKGVRETHPEAKIQEIFLQNQNIGYCKGCQACKTGKSNRCVFKDDIYNLYQDFEEADVFVIASPIYWYDVSAQTKTFIDRLYGSDFNNMYPNKQVVLLSSYAGKTIEEAGIESAISVIKRIADFFGAKFEQKYLVGTSSKEYYDSPVKHNKTALNEAYELGKQLRLEVIK
jgi:multimeric flavodoxin WrbA